MTHILKVLSLLLVSSSLLFSVDYIDVDHLSPSERIRIKKSVYVEPTVRKALCQTLKDVTDFFTNYGIQYYIAYGTHLGAARHHGPIPWDDDNDLIIHKNQGDILWSLKAPLEILGYGLCKNPIMGYHIYALTQVWSEKNQKNITPFVDIFTIERAAEGDKYILSEIEGRKKFPKSAYPAQSIDNPIQYQVGELTLWGPSHPENVFPTMYGETWNQKAHVYYLHHGNIKGHHYIWTLDDSDRNHIHYTGDLQDNVKNRLDFYTVNTAYWANLSVAALPPSSFAYYVRWDVNFKKGKILDLGGHTAQDVLFFRDFGIDAKSLNLVEKTLMAALKPYKTYDAFYARLFFNYITAEEESRVLEFLSTVKKGTRLFIEFRTDKDPLLTQSLRLNPLEDEKDPVAKTDHFRRFINFNRFKQALIETGFKLNIATEDNDLWEEETKNWSGYPCIDNPVLGRIIATKKTA